jgi:hypothetical protein
VAGAEPPKGEVEVGQIDVEGETLVDTVVEGAGVDLVRGLDPGSASVVVDAEASGDDRHPRVEPTLAREARERLERLDEGLLGDLLGFGVVVDPPLAEVTDPVEVEAVQLVEGGAVARLPGLDQGPVA